MTIAFRLLDIEMNIGLLALIGFIAGALGSYLGLGGAIIVTPFLNVLGAPMQAIVGTSSAYIAGTAAVATARGRTLGNVRLRVALIVALCMIPAIEGGAQFVSFLRATAPESADKAIRALYCVTLALLLVSVLFRDRLNARFKNPIALPPRIPLQSGESVSFLTLLVTGGLAGAMAGTLGIGGGVIIVPALSIFTRLSLREAAGTSSAIILLSSLYATGTYWAKSMIDFPAAGCLILGSAFGAFIGASLHKYASERGTRGALIAVIISSIAALLLRECALPVPAFIVIAAVSGAVLVFAFVAFFKGARAAHKGRSNSAQNTD